MAFFTLKEEEEVAALKAFSQRPALFCFVAEFSFLRSLAPTSAA